MRLLRFSLERMLLTWVRTVASLMVKRSDITRLLSPGPPDAGPRPPGPSGDHSPAAAVRDRPVPGAACERRKVGGTSRPDVRHGWPGLARPNLDRRRWRRCGACLEKRVRSIKLDRTYWADNPRVKRFLKRFPDADVIKFRDYVDESGEKRFTVEIEVY